MILASCNSFSSSTMIPTGVIQTQAALPTIAPIPQTSLPTIINTAFYTLIPTDTPTPIRVPTTATSTIEPVPFTYFRVIMTGLSKTGENIYSYTESPFRLFPALSSEIELFHFGLDIAASRFTKNELTLTPTAMPTSGWQLLIYRYRTDETYTNQIANKTNLAAVDKTNNDTIEIVLSADIMMKDLQTKFGDCSAFTFQVIDEQERVQL